MGKDLKRPHSASTSRRERARKPSKNEQKTFYSEKSKIVGKRSEAAAFGAHFQAGKGEKTFQKPKNLLFRKRSKIVGKDPKRPLSAPTSRRERARKSKNEQKTFYSEKSLK